MSIDELIAKTQLAAKNRTPAERRKLLQDANILDKNGHLKKGYFSKEAIEKSKQATSCNV